MTKQRNIPRPVNPLPRKSTKRRPMTNNEVLFRKERRERRIARVLDFLSGAILCLITLLLYVLWFDSIAR